MKKRGKTSKLVKNPNKTFFKIPEPIYRDKVIENKRAARRSKAPSKRKD